MKTLAQIKILVVGLGLAISLTPARGFAQAGFAFDFDDDKPVKAPTRPQPPARTTAPPPAPAPVPTPPAPARITPPSPVRPAKVQPQRTTPAPVTVTSEDGESEAGFCKTCPPLPPKRPAVLPKLEPSRVAGRDRTDRETPVASGDSGNACLRQKLLEGAKANVKRLYGNRGYSAGKCAQGVRLSMNASGVAHSDGMGDAVGWHLGGSLRRLGFKNIMRAGLNAYNAPPGAVLVFRGPATNMSSPTGGLPPRRARRGRSAGTWVGHVTIKGDRPGQYYTDGRTEAPAIAGRTLVAIYVPEKCVNCSARVKAACGVE